MVQLENPYSYTSEYVQGFFACSLILSLISAVIAPEIESKRLLEACLAKTLVK